MTPTTEPYPDPPGPVLFSAETIAAAVSGLGARITRDYAGKDLLIVTMLKGAVYFTSDLCRRIELPVRLDYMAISSYGDAGGVVRITKDLEQAIEGSDVLIVEDIIDTGLTLNYLLSVLRARRPAGIEICTLLDRDVRRIVDLPLAYRGFTLPDVFVVGYGLDWRGRMRNLPYVAALKDEHVMAG